MFQDAFIDTGAVRSYSTLKNARKDVADNDFGDIVVADYNFDGLEDVAIKRDSGGNGGPAYNFYLQNTGWKFILNNFLSFEMTYFPTHITKKKRTLTTFVHANAMGVNKHTYKLDVLTNRWSEIARTFVGYKE